MFYVQDAELCNKNNRFADYVFYFVQKVYPQKTTKSFKKKHQIDEKGSLKAQLSKYCSLCFIKPAHGQTWEFILLSAPSCHELSATQYLTRFIYSALNINFQVHIIRIYLWYVPNNLQTFIKNLNCQNGIIIY